MAGIRFATLASPAVSVSACFVSNPYPALIPQSVRVRVAAEGFCLETQACVHLAVTQSLTGILIYADGDTLSLYSQKRGGRVSIPASKISKIEVERGSDGLGKPRFRWQTQVLQLRPTAHSPASQTTSLAAGRRRRGRKQDATDRRRADKTRGTLLFCQRPSTSSRVAFAIATTSFTKSSATASSSRVDSRWPTTAARCSPPILS